MSTTTTVKARSEDQVRNGWADFVAGGDYTAKQVKKLINNLMVAFKDEVNGLLPAGWVWHPYPGEITLPLDQRAELDDIDLDELMVEASSLVVARFERGELG